jgi:hypothetical protein
MQKGNLNTKIFVNQIPNPLNKMIREKIIKSKEKKLNTSKQHLRGNEKNFTSANIKNRIDSNSLKKKVKNKIKRLEHLNDNISRSKNSSKMKNSQSLLQKVKKNSKKNNKSFMANDLSNTKKIKISDTNLPKDNSIKKVNNIQIRFKQNSKITFSRPKGLNLSKEKPLTNITSIKNVSFNYKIGGVNPLNKIANIRKTNKSSSLSNRKNNHLFDKRSKIRIGNSIDKNKWKNQYANKNKINRTLNSCNDNKQKNNTWMKKVNFLTNKLNSRNNNHALNSDNIYHNNFSNNKSTIVNLKQLNTGTINYYKKTNEKRRTNAPNKTKNASEKRRAIRQFCSEFHSPNKSSNKNQHSHFFKISNMIYENKKIRENNNNLSLQINDMAKQFENMRKENISIKNELKEKTKLIKDMKLTIDIFHQELIKLQKQSNKNNNNNNNK